MNRIGKGRSFLKQRESIPIAVDIIFVSLLPNKISIRIFAFRYFGR